MKIAFFTEGDWSGSYYRGITSARTDVAWQVALNATHYNIRRRPDAEFDIGIVIIPKNNPIFDFKHIKDKCKKVGIMQEGPHWYFQDYKVSEQISYIQALHNADFILCHNKKDMLYYKGLVNSSKCFTMPSLMLEDSIPSGVEKVSENRNGAVIGGNMTSWYGGIDSLLVAQEFGEEIYAPSMGRRQPGEEHIEGLNHIPYLTWSDWMVQLSKRKYGVHLMRTFAAGTFSLNCAYFGIPCIGWNYMDTQTLLFPELSFEVGDMVSAREAAKQLREDPSFYKECSYTAFKTWKSHFREEQFVNHMSSIFSGVL